MRNLDVTNDLGKVIKLINITLITRVVARPTRESCWEHIVYKKNRLFRKPKVYDYWVYANSVIPEYCFSKHTEKDMLSLLEKDEYFKDGKVWLKPVITIRIADGKTTECFYDSNEDMLSDLRSLQEFNPNLLVVSSI